MLGRIYQVNDTNQLDFPMGGANIIRLPRYVEIPIKPVDPNPLCDEVREHFDQYSQGSSRITRGRKGLTHEPRVDLVEILLLLASEIEPIISPIPTLKTVL